MVHRVQDGTQNQTLGGLLGALADDGKLWFRAELAVIKAQIENTTSKLQTAIIMLILAVVIALAGIIVLAHALALMLAPIFGLALGGFIVGGLLIGLAVVFVLYARSLIDIERLIPSRLRKGLSSKPESRP